MESNQDITGYYIQPSFSKMIVTHAGNLCDFAGANNIGLWDPKSMKNLNLITGIPAQDSQIYAKAMIGGNGNRIIMYSADKFQIMDLDNKKDPLIWEKISTTDDIQQIAINPSNTKEICVLMVSGYINIWDIEEKKIIQSFQTIRKMYRRIQIFPGGKYLALQDKGGFEINILERSTGIEQKITFKSPASRFLVLNENEIAIVLKNYVQIRNIAWGIHNIQAQLICDDPSENFESVLLLNNNKWLIAAGEKGILRVWDIEQQKIKFQLDTNSFNDAHKLARLNHIHSIFILQKSQKLCVLNSEERRLRVFKIDENFENPEFQKSFQYDSDYSTSINSFEMAFSLNGKNLIGLFSQKGNFIEDEVVFTKEIEILDLDTSTIIASKDLSQPGYILEQETMRSNGQNKLYYRVKSESNSQRFYLEFDVEKFLSLPQDKRSDPKNNSLYENWSNFSVQNEGQFVTFTPIESHIDSIIVAYGVTVPDLAKGDLVVKYGISVYDYKINQRWQHLFETDFIVKFSCMIDRNTIAFVNPKNCIEFWNIESNDMIKQFDLSEYKFVISKFLISQDLLIIVDPQNKLHVIDLETEDELDQIQLCIGETIKSIQMVGHNKCIVLYQNETIQKVDLEEFKIEKHNRNQPITNILVLPKESKQEEPLVLLLIEEYVEIRNFKNI
ncbi:hypothetical protein TTHERM_00621160 (macronuclear) [Tetrahymena thermophila SB210]|uniref:Uncharacterized protein n=1 Tax=Tetrahymena thermophila (strain SB210) TaxID=312017 RepID=Q23ME3_TETTS|nr:hypothetical protein TTHERM_00621160 [Tetrahymena thermophila SB210]EAR97696.1 hypothetical protein TTHERM_00621160 [Tetrahymena thermophila SB210]|eukprot:XP_001017941.1 hypothetical protein TTHERM_00621160 [Tetrahymena thermophila SB210]